MIWPLVSVSSASVDQCGALTAWANGLPVGKINNIPKHGCHADLLVLRVDQLSVCLMFVELFNV